MKIRHGFVSNSSSSSFIVGFDKKPETVEELQELLFRGQSHFHAPYCDTVWSAREVTERVFRDLSEQSPLTEEELIEELSCGYHYGEGGLLSEDSIYKLCDGKDFDWDLYDKFKKQNAKILLEKLTTRHRNKIFFRLVYSDNDGELPSAMEHGDLFDLIPHIRISLH